MDVGGLLCVVWLGGLLESHLGSSFIQRHTTFTSTCCFSSSQLCRKAVAGHTHVTVPDPALINNTYLVAQWNSIIHTVNKWGVLPRGCLWRDWGKTRCTLPLVCFILHVLCGEVPCFQYYCHSFGADAQFGSGGAPLLCARNDYSNIIL